jgi:hypothetical protein
MWCNSDDDLDGYAPSPSRAVRLHALSFRKYTITMTLPFSVAFVAFLVIITIINRLPVVGYPFNTPDPSSPLYKIGKLYCFTGIKSHLVVYD